MATRNAEALLLRIDADMSKMRGELTRAEQKTIQSGNRMALSLGRVNQAMGGLTRAAGKMGAVVGGVVAVGLAMLVKRSVETADSIAKAADNIGITTDALQEYRFAADLSGVANEKLDISFKQFAKRIGELRANTGSMITFLKEYDKTLLNNLKSSRSTTDALDLIFAAMGRAKDQADRAALASAAFGRSGIDLTRIVKGGAGALELMRIQAREMGIVLDEDLVRNAEESNDQLTILGKVIETRVMAAILKLSPEIGELAEKLANGIPKLVGWVKGFAEFIGLIEDANLERLKKIRNEIELINSTTQLGAGMGGDTMTAADQKHLAMLRQAEAEAGVSLDAFGGSKVTASGGGKSAPVVSVFTSKFKPPDMAKLEKLRDKAGAARLKERDVALKVLEDIRQATLRATEQEITLINRRLAAKIESLEKLRLTEEEKAAARVELNRAAEAEIVKVIEKRGEAAKKALEEQAKAAEDLAGRFSDSVVDSLASGEDAFRSLGKVALSVMNDIAKSLIRSGIKSLIGGVDFSNLFGGGGQAAADFAGGVALSTPFYKGAAFAGGNVIKMARGRVVTRPTSFPLNGGSGVMGEHGKEGVLPLARDGAGRLGVRPVGGGGGGSIAIEQNITVNAGVSQTVRAEMMGLMPIFKQQAIDGILEVKQLGGDAARILEG